MEPPPPRDNTGLDPLDWSALGFHLLGLYDLWHRLGKPQNCIFWCYHSSFEAADLAWFAAGLATKPCNIQANKFYPELHALRNNTGLPNGVGTEIQKALCKSVRDLTFDCAALLDRAFGGTTLVIHVPGTTRPRSPKQLEYVKADIYFPGHLAREDIRYSEAVSDIVQRFIRDVSLPTIA
ncbi:hypothetical protein CVT25_008393 [Psilocybe cyanescens]|uniref:Uncharacterized protein n=1 Tax=Psilocybe cyanescens TaxID=93625 RepID=A0A409XVN5_PSICY|nr:hypothetical protein CVT25_008393 [Psilocybe cyanescens]